MFIIFNIIKDWKLLVNTDSTRFDGVNTSRLKTDRNGNEKKIQNKFLCKQMNIFTYNFFQTI